MTKKKQTVAEGTDNIYSQNHIEKASPEATGKALEKECATPNTSDNDTSHDSSKIEKADDCIEVKGARANNLKGVDLRLPRGKFAVITGVSGSGKSSLAFDTLYAEGRRRYVESLSAYARQFLGRIPKPECDYIKGLPPAIAIEQKVGSHNPRSTVGTATELNDYLRMLFARAGHTYSPISGREVSKQSPEKVVDELLALPEGTRIAVTAPINMPEGRDFNQQLEIYLQEGYSRLEHNGEFVDISEALESQTPMSPAYYRLLIDRLSISDDDDTRSRLTDSVETAYFEGHDEFAVRVYDDGDSGRLIEFSRRFALDGMEFREPSDLMFNFNNPYGACTKCEGFGSVLGISEDLVIPDRSLSVYQGAVACWKGEKMDECRRELISLSSSIGFPIHKPYSDLTREELDILWHGKGPWEGIDGFFRWVDSNQYKIQYRVMKARYRGKTACPVCHGSRLKPDAEYVKINGKSFSELLAMPIGKLRSWFDSLTLTETDNRIAERLLREIKSRLRYLDDVGLGYLSLSRSWGSLSGGESQRIKLATALGSSLVGSLYVLDEPSIGLHPRDTQRLIGVLKHLRDIGNTLVVVEHDEEIMRAADWLVDVGPGAGSLGGRVLYNGPIPVKGESVKALESRTLRCLEGEETIPVPELRHPWQKRISIEGAAANNLRSVNVDFPLGVLTVVTGVSGSGKSTLVRDILYRGLANKLGIAVDKPGFFQKMKGDIKDIRNVEFVDQNPIGTSTRSNAATYLKIYDDIRRLYSEQPLARQLNFTPSFFSFNTEGGRCEECKGEGVLTIPMQFMADIQVPCPECGGKRFGRDVLEVQYRGKTISDILGMTVSDAFVFFNEAEAEDKLSHRIARSLQPLLDVGLGYLPLGQPSSTLSGGENQRLKLAYFLSNVADLGHTMFILDEPTTGLHTTDIATLLASLRQLIERGNTVVIIEHNMHVAKSADYIIDLGPEGGEGGGCIVAAGTPEEIAACPDSLTGKALRDAGVK